MYYKHIIRLIILLRTKENGKHEIRKIKHLPSHCYNGIDIKKIPLNNRKLRQNIPKIQDPQHPPSPSPKNTYKNLNVALISVRPQTAKSTRQITNRPIRIKSNKSIEKITKAIDNS